MANKIEIKNVYEFVNVEINDNTFEDYVMREAEYQAADINLCQLYDCFQGWAVQLIWAEYTISKKFITKATNILEKYANSDFAESRTGWHHDTYSDWLIAIINEDDETI